MVTLSKNISTTLKTKQGDITEDEVTFHWGQGGGAADTTNYSVAYNFC